MARHVRIMKDERNGIYPVLVFTEDDATGDNDDVLALYPFGWEEYSGIAKLGRFSFVSDDEDVMREILTLRHFLKRALRCSDKALGDEAVLLDENADNADILDDYVVNLARF